MLDLTPGFNCWAPEGKKPRVIDYWAKTTTKWEEIKVLYDVSHYPANNMILHRLRLKVSVANRIIYVNILRARQNGSHFSDDIFKCIFLNEDVRISIEIEVFLNQWWITFLRHICVTRPQWVKDLSMRCSGSWDRRNEEATRIGHWMRRAALMYPCSPDFFPKIFTHLYSNQLPLTWYSDKLNTTIFSTW